MANAEILDRTQAIVAPGQGSQRPYMGLELAKKSPAAAKAWRDGDQALFSTRESPFTDLVWRRYKGTRFEQIDAEVILTNPENAQPAIIIDSLARKAALEEIGLYSNPYWHSGNSLGFIVACVTSGAIETTGAAELGEARGKAQKFAINYNPKIKTGMMAVQHDNPQTVVEVVADLQTKFGLSVCLLNTDNQVVVGGEVKDIEAAKEYVMKQDPKMGELLRILSVAGAYHSRYMEPGVSIYAEEVDKIDIQLPSGGLIAGSTVEPLTTIDSIKKALVAQFTQTERWRDVVRFLRKQGVVTIIELNSASTLSDMNRRLLGGEREKIVFPNALDSEGSEITIGWRWQAPIALVERPVQEIVTEVPEVIELEGQYAKIGEMELFLALPAPKTYNGVLLWYRKWTAIRTGKDLAEIDAYGNFVDDAGIDSLDYSVLRADVQGTFGRLVDEKEAEANVTPVLAAKATYALLSSGSKDLSAPGLA